MVEGWSSEMVSHELRGLCCSSRFTFVGFKVLEKLRRESRKTHFMVREVFGACLFGVAVTVFSPLSATLFPRKWYRPSFSSVL